MESYRTEEEQVEAMRRWWSENGRSTMIAIVVALAAGFGWQGWQKLDQARSEAASHMYHALLESVNGTAAGDQDFTQTKSKAEEIINEYDGTTYAQFAALYLAKLAAEEGDLDEAQNQLRWVLSKAAAKSDIAEIAQLRLARVLAASGDTDQALNILNAGQAGAYAASYAIAKGDIYMQLGRDDEAGMAYADARISLMESGISGSVATLDQKIQSLNPVPSRVLDGGTELESATAEQPVEKDTVDTLVNQEG
jgi:predicted negative regulator of RcsB-dependent stress response